MTIATTFRRVLAAAAALALLPAAAPAQDDAPPPRVMGGDGTSVNTAQGELFRSVEAGLELQLPPGTPAGAAALDADPTLLAAVSNEAENWQFQLRKIALDRPMQLRSEDLPEGGRRVGLLDLMADEVRAEVNGDVLRQSFTPLGDADAGVFAVRYSLGPATFLRQDALVKAGDTLYYRLSLVSPAPTGPVEELGDDPAVRRAVQVFGDALDSFRAVDQTALFEEQQDRLLRTRATLVNLKVRGRMAEACAGEQWWRVQKDGRDIGYARVIEEPANGLPQDMARAFAPGGRQDNAAAAVEAEGVRVGVAARLQTESGVMERRTWSYAARDMETADFRESNALFGPGGDAEEDDDPASMRGWVIGQMRTRMVPRSTEVRRPGGLGTERVMDIEEQRRLEVTFTRDGEVLGQPFEQSLPAWYVPQAAEHLLPRLVAPYGERTYMVAVYAPDRRQVWNQYVDVGVPRRMAPPGGGGERSIIPVSVRRGLGGPATEHFVDAETFEWLGDRNDETGVTKWPTTREELAAVWADTPMLEGQE